MDRLSERALGVCLASLTLMTFGVAASRVFYPFDTGHYEAYMWAPAQLILEGKNPYRTEYVLNPPYTAAAYGAFYYWLISLGIGEFGLQLWFGRLIAAFSQAALIGCVGWWVHHHTRDRGASAIAMIACLSSTPLLYWVAFQRSDLPGLFFTTLGCALAITGRWESFSSSLRFLVAGAIMAVGIFCKHVFVLCIPLSFVLAALTGSLVGGAIAIGSALFFLASGIAFLQFTSGGGYLWQYLELPRGLETSLARAWSSATPFLISPPLLAAVILFFQRKRFENRNALSKVEGVFWIYALVAFTEGTILARFKGSNLNYFVEASVALALSLGLVAVRLRSNQRVVLAAFLTLGGLANGLRTIRGEYFRWKSLPYYQAVVERLEALVPKGELILSPHPELAVSAMRDYEFNDLSQYEDGRSPALTAVLRQAIDQTRYAAIVSLTPSPPRGYHKVSLSIASPSRFYPVFLFVRDTDASPPRPARAAPH